MHSKIQKIEVVKLFNEYNHQIDLSNGVQVIMGANGIGKTTILKLVNSLFSGDMLSISNIKFERLEVSFASKESIQVARSEEKGDVFIKVSLFDEKKEIKESYKWSQNELINEERIEDGLSHSNYPVPLSYVIQRRIRRQFESKNNEFAAFLKRIMEYCQTEFIPAQRLQMPTKGNDPVATVNKISRDLKKYILSVFAKTAQQSNELDQSFPERLIEKLKNVLQKSPKTHVNQLLSDVVDELNLLYSAGILDESQILKKNMLRSISSTQQSQALVVLDLYLTDYLGKLKLNRTLAQKLNLYFQTLNEHFVHKKVGLNQERELYIKSTYTGEEIPINRLSSGEQNELILFYYLIFECDDKQLALIDEPEISLHIKWLDKLLPIFREIANNNGMQMLIATHSPDFVGSNTDILQILSE